MEIQVKGSGKSAIVLIHDGENKLEIWPYCGGIINSWYASTERRTINIISGYLDYEDFKNNCETKGFRSCKLSPYAGRIKKSSYSYEEEEREIGKFGFDDHNIHGLIYDRHFKVIETSNCEKEAIVTLATEYREINEGFPFNYRMEIRYKLSSNGKLTVETKVTNLSEKEMPLCDGWHPYFNLGTHINECYLQINSDKILEFDSDLIPTGKISKFGNYAEPELIEEAHFDNCFEITNTSDKVCVLKDPVSGLTISLYNELNYPYLQLFTPDDRNSLAIEPLSAPPDSFNNKIGLKYIGHGECISFICRWEVNVE